MLTHMDTASATELRKAVDMREVFDNMMPNPVHTILGNAPPPLPFPSVFLPVACARAVQSLPYVLVCCPRLAMRYLMEATYPILGAISHPPVRHWNPVTLC